MNEMCLFAKWGLLDTGLKPRCSYHGPQWARWCQRCSIYRILLLLWCNAVTVYQIRAFVIHYIPWPSAWLQWKKTRRLFCQLQINDWRRYSWVTFFSFQVFSLIHQSFRFIFMHFSPHFHANIRPKTQYLTDLTFEHLY